MTRTQWFLVAGVVLAAVLVASGALGEAQSEPVHEPEESPTSRATAPITGKPKRAYRKNSGHAPGRKRKPKAAREAAPETPTAPIAVVEVAA